MSDIEQHIENLHPGNEPLPVPIREGLPPTYRMRADSHYVEQLESTPGALAVKHVDVRAIEVRGEDPHPAADFVESIRHHGVLQPLLVQTRGGRYRLIAGRRRLSAAITAGLREVPCLIQRVDEEQAHAMAEATNLPSATTPAAGTDNGPLGADSAAEALAQSLSALASSANLLSGGSSLAQTVASDLVRAEAARALQLLLASRVLRGDMAVARSRLVVRYILDRAMHITAAERHLRAVDVHVNDGARDALVRGDEELLAGAVAGLLIATIALVSDLRGPVLLGTTIRPDGRVAISVSQESLTVPDAWVKQTFDALWPISSATPSSLLLMQSARRIAEAHGGQAIAVSTETGPSLSIALPAVLREM
jgi:ParB/RepB/Spo0J family partition protein